MTPQEKSLDLLQQFGCSTMFTEANDGMTLPLYVAKKIALIAVREIQQVANAFSETENMFWEEVKTEIIKR